MQLNCDLILIYINTHIYLHIKTGNEKCSSLIRLHFTQIIDKKRFIKELMLYTILKNIPLLWMIEHIFKLFLTYFHESFNVSKNLINVGSFNVVCIQ